MKKRILTFGAVLVLVMTTKSIAMKGQSLTAGFGVLPASARRGDRNSSHCLWYKECFLLTPVSGESVSCCMTGGSIGGAEAPSIPY